MLSFVDPGQWSQDQACRSQNPAADIPAWLRLSFVHAVSMNTGLQEYTHNSRKYRLHASAVGRRESTPPQRRAEGRSAAHCVAKSLFCDLIERMSPQQAKGRR
jgi:hypothetical protein